MAGERKGRTYEAIFFLVLQELKRRRRIKGDIYWNKTPAGMTIEPDFTVGPDVNHPQIVFLVTHSGSAKNSDMKFWRNIGELAETKTRLEKIPRVYNIAFDSVIKEDLKILQAAAFDGQIIVGDKRYGRNLQKWIDKNSPKLPKDGEEKSEAIKEIIKDPPPGDNLSDLFKELVSDVATLLKSTDPGIDKLWTLARERLPGKAPIAKETFIRRGLSKLLVFEDAELAIRLYRGARVRIEEVPAYAYQLGLAKKTLGRAAPGDKEVLNAVGLLSDEKIRAIVRSAPLAKMEGWLLTLRNAPHLSFMGQYVIDEYDALCDAEELSLRLKRLHEDPWALVDKSFAPEKWPPPSVWLLEYLIELLKAASGSANGYGYAQLARDVVSSGHGKQKDLADAGQFGGGFGLSAWVSRKKTGFREDLVEGIAAVISRKISDLGKDKVKKIVSKIPNKIAKNIIEAKLCTHRDFSPLKLLISQLVKHPAMVQIKSCFSERAKLKGRASKTQVIKTRSTLINWQSVSDAGRDHKKKELCGRAVALRYSWDPKKKTFISRPGVKKLVLVLDGTWRQQDLDALAYAGWDHILYPDEIEKLVKVIE